MLIPAMISTRPHHSQRRLPPLSGLLALLLNSDFLAAVGAIWRSARRLIAAQIQEGMYEVLAFDAELELQDARGRVALLDKRQRVRFLQDNIIAYQDLAWGDGEIFSEYECSPGVAVDRYREGHRWRVLISLRETRNRGDVEEFRIRRKIQGGFTKGREELQAEVNHKTRGMRMSVVFPEKRLPKRVSLIEQNLNRSTTLGPENHIRLPDQRLQVTWSTDKPRLFEAYILRWEW
jgi:hypothetical protein